MSENDRKIELLENRLIEIENRLNLLEKKKKTSRGKPREKTGGSLIWDIYEKFWLKRYSTAKEPPIRNAKINRHAKQLFDEYGFDRASAIVQFYLTQNDAFYLKTMHSFEFITSSAPTLWARMQTGKSITSQQANRLERTQSNKSNILEYLEETNG